MNCSSAGHPSHSTPAGSFALLRISRACPVVALVIFQKSPMKMDFKHETLQTLISTSTLDHMKGNILAQNQPHTLADEFL